MGNWSKPANNYYKINVKGIFNRPAMKASVGCVIRDSNGAWVTGCGGMIGLAVPVTAQLWAIFYGLKHAWEKGRKLAIIECDSAEAVQHVLNNDPTFEMVGLVDLINNLLSEAWDDIQVTYVPHSQNVAATALAFHCQNGDGGVDEIIEPPEPVRVIVANEMM